MLFVWKLFFPVMVDDALQVALTQYVDTLWLLMSTHSHKPIVNWNITSWKRISFAFVFGTPQLNVALSKLAQSLKFPCSWTKSAGFITYMAASHQALGWRWTQVGCVGALSSWTEWTPLTDTVSGAITTPRVRGPLWLPLCGLLPRCELFDSQRSPSCGRKSILLLHNACS